MVAAVVVVGVGVGVGRVGDSWPHDTMNPAMSAATAASLNRDMVICLPCSTDRRSQAPYPGPGRNGGGPDESRDDHQVCPDLLGSEKPDGGRIEAAVNRE